MRPGMSSIANVSPAYAAKVVAFVALCGALAGCAVASQPPPQAMPSATSAAATDLKPVPGFLPLPGSLRPGKPGEFDLSYINPAVDPSLFNNVMLDPVRLWAPPGSPLAKLPRPQQQEVAKAFYAELLDALQRRCRVAQQPRRNTLRLSFALVDVSAPNPVAVETVTGGQSGRASNPGSPGFDANTGSFAAAATIEGFARDPDTGIVVWQGVDRSGTTPPGSPSTWSDVRRIFASWSDQIVAKLRQAQVCV